MSDDCISKQAAKKSIANVILRHYSAKQATSLSAPPVDFRKLTLESSFSADTMTTSTPLATPPSPAIVDAPVVPLDDTPLDLPLSELPGPYKASDAMINFMNAEGMDVFDAFAALGPAMTPPGEITITTQPFVMKYFVATLCIDGVETGLHGPASKNVDLARFGLIRRIRQDFVRGIFDINATHKFT